MSTTFTFPSGAVITPTVFDGWVQRRTRGATAHEIIGGGVDYTHRPRLYRTGTFSLVFDGENDARALDEAIAAEPYFDLSSDEAAAPNGRFVAVGDVEVRQHEIRAVWLVRFDASEDV